MREYYIRLATYGEGQPHIIDEEAMYQAERGMNYLNPDDFTFLCEANNLAEAKEYYMEEFSRMAFDKYAESLHP